MQIDYLQKPDFAYIQNKTEIQSKPDDSINNTVEYTATAAGVGRDTVFRIIKVYKSDHTSH